ncbi:hypothetical protein X975_20117, partial [Stegodyphus mimosarum]
MICYILGISITFRFYKTIVAHSYLNSTVLTLLVHAIFKSPDS